MTLKTKTAARPKSRLGSIQATATTLTDGGVPLEHRKAVLGRLCLDENPDSAQIVALVLEKAAQANGEAMAAKKAEELTLLMEEIRNGPLRRATYLAALERNGNGARRVQVVLENGDSAYPVAPDAEFADSLTCGDNVLLDAQCRTVLYRDPAGMITGEQARLERRVDEERVEAMVRDHEPFVFRLSAALKLKVDGGEVEPGAKLLVCSRRAMAFEATPAANGVSHYRYMVQEPPPDVIVDRDVGDPPRFLFDLIDHLRTEMERPELGRRYNLRRAVTRLLTGVSGSGKSLSIRAFWRLMYELMSEKTGVPLEQLPCRVVRLRLPQILSKWLGESDKNLDRFFTEVEELADEPFTAPDGTQYELPVLAICEEIDGLARARGSSDPVYDRIQTTGLERLDLNTARLGEKLVTFIFTTNVPSLIDPAFLRRAGGQVERFGRLNRRGFLAVLDKHVAGLPMRKSLGATAEKAKKRLMSDVSEWLYSPNGSDQGQVEITYVGSSTPVVKHRRDFLTGALVDRAVQQAAVDACRGERRGEDQPGICSTGLIRALDGQVRAVVDQLTPQNVGEFVTLPDGVRVGQIRRIPQSSLQPHDYRTS